MVVSTETENERSFDKDFFASISAKPGDVPMGDYCLVGWDLDTTGHKLLDEVCHVAGYTPDDTFSLYVMPHGDIRYPAQKRHMIRIFTVKTYRVIKDVTSNKVLKTKSEISALTDFLDWLEKLLEKSGKNGVLLICHEQYKFNPHLLLQSIKKFNLLDRFSSIVKGFVDCCEFAKKVCETTMVSFTIRTLSKVLLDKDNVDICKASDRAMLAFEVVQHLCAGSAEIGSGATSPDIEIVKSVLPFTTSVSAELKVLNDIKTRLEMQGTLKPIFNQFMGYNSNPTERKNAVMLRKYLVDAGLDYETLKSSWTDGKEALEAAIKGKMTAAQQEKADEIVKLVTQHFENPEATPPSPPKFVRNGKRDFVRRGGPRRYRGSHKSSRNGSNGVEEGGHNGGSEPEEAGDHVEEIDERPIQVAD